MIFGYIVRLSSVKRFAKLAYMCDITHTLAVKRYSKTGASYPYLEVTLDDWGNASRNAPSSASNNTR
jgi:hypothetical protein